MMETKLRKLYDMGIVLIVLASCLALVGCGGGSAQSSMIVRSQPSGGKIVNPWVLAEQRTFETLEESFLQQVAYAKQLDPDSPEVRKLESDYQKIKSLWQIRIQEKKGQQPKPDDLPESFVNSIGITMTLIKPGTFQMGSYNGMGDEKPVHSVTISKPFYMGVYEVTEGQYSAIMGGSGSSAPKVNVSWNEAVLFCERLSTKEGLHYSLPSEAQWEYACRAGTTTTYSFGDQWDEVASRQPNPWGLYDMHGNVWEWCQDWYGSYPSGSQTDPVGPASGSFRVFRGGSWDYDATGCRVANRSNGTPTCTFISVGFRVALAPAVQ